MSQGNSLNMRCYQDENLLIYRNYYNKPMIDIPQSGLKYTQLLIMDLKYLRAEIVFTAQSMRDQYPQINRDNSYPHLIVKSKDLLGLKAL
jgi:hypothetical protein